MKRYPCALACLLSSFVALGHALSIDGPSGDVKPFDRVKAAPPLRALLLDGYDRSPTIREIVDQIAASGWLVFVQKAPCQGKAMIACLRHFVGRFDGAPYLRVHVDNLHRHPDNVIGSIAHELQHAREVVTASDISDAESIRDLFRRIGYVSVQGARVTTYETTAALAVGEAVRKELSLRPRSRREGM